MADLLLESPLAPSNLTSTEAHRSAEGHRPVGLRRLALVIEYQGTRYHGFQLQPSHPTIQAELEQALYRLTGQSMRIRGASRTDSGAHAAAQVVDFLTEAPLSSDVFLRGLNSYLPADIKVRGSYEVGHDFHSRRSALSRRYRYTFLNRPTPSPLVREFSQWVRDPLNVTPMNDAARHLIGLHDFAPVAGVLPSGQSTIRNVLRWELWRDGELVLMEAQANGFLPHQIRRVGALLLEVGLGRLEPDAVQNVLSGQTTMPAWCAALPARGLCLMSVEYNDFPPESKGT